MVTRQESGKNPGSPPSSSVDMLDAVFTGRNEKGIPTFSVKDISAIPFDASIVPWMDQAQQMSRTLFRRQRPPLEVLYTARDRVVPDYTPDLYIGKNNISDLPLEVETGILPRVEAGVVGTLIKTRMKEYIQTLPTQEGSRKKVAVSVGAVQKIREGTSREVREMIRDLVGPSHKIRDTYRVGHVQATEVIPQSKVDPLFCVRIEDPRLDSSLNHHFRAAFVLAMIGRANDEPAGLKLAGQTAEAAGYKAYASALRGEASWSFAEMLFLGEIIYGNALTRGFRHGLENPIGLIFSRLFG